MSEKKKGCLTRPEFHKVKCEFNGKEYTIIHEDANLWLDKLKVEEKYNCKYIGEFTLKTKDKEWADTPVSIFYQETIPLQYKTTGSRYFGIFKDTLYNKVMITNAIAAVGPIYSAILNTENNEALYSAFRHDFQYYEGLMIDGGLEYIKCSAYKPLVKFKIVGDKLKILSVVVNCTKESSKE